MRKREQSQVAAQLKPDTAYWVTYQTEQQSEQGKGGAGG